VLDQVPVRYADVAPAPGIDEVMRPMLAQGRFESSECTKGWWAGLVPDHRVRTQHHLVAQLDRDARLPGRTNPPAAHSRAAVAGLGSPADRRAYVMQRHLADVILVGVGAVHGLA
jgi:hypothetical protein